MRAACISLALALATPVAAAQSNPSSRDEGDVLNAAPGRVPVRVVTPSGRLRVGLAQTAPDRARQGTHYTNEEHASVCMTPCTLYLRPGAHRLFGDAGTDLAWNADVTVAPASPLRVNLRGHSLWISAASGALLIVGLAGTLGGPALIIGSAIVGEPRAPPEVFIAGSIAGVAGAFMLWGAVRLRDLATARVEALPDRAPGTPQTPQAPRASVLPAAIPGGALLLTTIVF